MTTIADLVKDAIDNNTLLPSLSKSVAGEEATPAEPVGKPAVALASSGLLPAELTNKPGSSLSQQTEEKGLSKSFGLGIESAFKLAQENVLGGKAEEGDVSDLISQLIGRTSGAASVKSILAEKAAPPPQPNEQLETDVTITSKGLQQIIQDESSGKDHLSAYKDSRGIATVGHGFNLQEPSNRTLFKRVTGLEVEDVIEGRANITKDQQMELLHQTIAVAEADAQSLFPSFMKFKPDVQDALINFVFNLGKSRAAEFRNTIAAFERGDAAAAARGLRNSKWAKQVGPRADRIIATVEAGLFPEKPKADKSIKVNVNG